MSLVSCCLYLPTLPQNKMTRSLEKHKQGWTQRILVKYLQILDGVIPTLSPETSLTDIYAVSIFARAIGLVVSNQETKTAQ